MEKVEVEVRETKQQKRKRMDAYRMAVDKTKEGK
jgi:hypothetical protein